MVDQVSEDTFYLAGTLTDGKGKLLFLIRASEPLYEVDNAVGAFT